MLILFTMHRPFKGTVSPAYICLDVFWLNKPWFEHIVSLPRGSIQEIKCMLLVHLTHGLFLT
jgi:hypothetical protein